ncbi:MAG TPA: hypothetical protein VFH68_19710, partial [Polyangia bacterium]|nr:hypothetical protein [Polyangia bacterium]
MIGLGLFAAVPLGVLGTVPLGCTSEKPVDLGNNVGSALADYSGDWDGYAEAYSFETTGSDRVRIALDATGHGTIRFGDSALLNPPTDPTSIMLSGLDTGSALVGFEFPLYDGRVEGNRVRLTVSPKDIYGAWCPLQTVVATAESPTGYGCAVQPVTYDPQLGGCFRADEWATTDGGADAGPAGVNCAQAALCGASSVCTCTASGCTITPPTGNDSVIKIDATLENNGANLVGTLLLDGQTRVT